MNIHRGYHEKQKHINDSMFIEDLSKWYQWRQYKVLLGNNDNMSALRLSLDNHHSHLIFLIFNLYINAKISIWVIYPFTLLTRQISFLNNRVKKKAKTILITSLTMLGSLFSCFFNFPSEKKKNSNYLCFIWRDHLEDITADFATVQSILYFSFLKCVVSNCSSVVLWRRIFKCDS